MRRLLATLLAATVVAIVAAGCGSNDDGNRNTRAAASGPSAPSGAGELTDIKSIEQLRDAFNAHSDQPRLIVLASPT
jgi:hypothetical protein